MSTDVHTRIQLIRVTSVASVANMLVLIHRGTSRLSQQNKPDLSQVIAEEFGANATYVEGLLERFRSNPDLVDDSWRSYFTELIGGDGNGAKGCSALHASDQPRAARRLLLPNRSRRRTRACTATGREAIPLRGPALKIVENMESSLSVPTATSERRIPVKLLDENRRIINQHLAENDRGKASYTHLIAWAMLRALDSFRNSTMASLKSTARRRG